MWPLIMEPGKGLEPLNLPITNRLLHLRTAPAYVSISAEISSNNAAVSSLFFYRTTIMSVYKLPAQIMPNFIDVNDNAFLEFTGQSLHRV